jgi:hypothetical protein
MFDTKPIFDTFDGGLVTKYEPNKLENNQSPDLININFTGRNSFTKRRGYEIVGNYDNTPGNITSLFTYRKLDGTEYLIRFNTVTLEYLLAGTWTQIPTSPLFTGGAKFGNLTYRNILYVGNGIQDSAKWDGTTWTNLNTLNFPRGNIFAAFQGRIFMAGKYDVPGFENRVFYSKLSNVESFVITGTAPDIGGEIILDSRITAMVPRNDALVVFTEKKIFSITISATTGLALVTDVSQSNGANTSYATVPVENDIWYQDFEAAIRSLGERVNYAQLRSDVQSVLIDRSLEKLNILNSCGIYFNRQFFVSSATEDSTFNDVVYLWDANYGTWRKYEGIFANQFTLYQKKVYFASSADKNVYVLDKEIYSDNGGAIFSRYSTPNLTFGDALHWKRMRYFLIKGYISENAVLTIKFIYDNNDDNAIIKKIYGSDTAVVDETVSISFGNTVFGSHPFGSFSEFSEAVPVRPFLAKLSLGTVNFYECRIVVEETGADTDYSITHMQPIIEMQEEPHFEPQRVK